MLPNPLPTRLNLGCGYDKRPGYLNIDMDPQCSPELLIVDNDLSVLPRRYFTEVAAYDVLEHIPRAITTDVLLEWADLMPTGALLEAETSSVEAIVDLMRARPGYASQAEMTIWMFGNQCHPGDFHYTGFTEATLKVHLLAAGFEVSRLEIRHDWCFWLQAHKVENWTALLDDPSTDDEAFVIAAYQSALGREPEPVYRDLEVGWIKSGEKDRRAILKKLFSSEERRLVVAQRNGL